MAADPSNVTLTRVTAHMPVPGSKDAPHFDGVYPTDFIKRVDILCRNAALENENEKVEYLYMYCSDRIKEQICFWTAFDLDKTNKRWEEAKTVLIDCYGHTDIRKRVTAQTLEDYCSKHSAESNFRSESDVAKYYTEFNSIAGPLLKTQDITQKIAQIKFQQGIPKDFQQWFYERLPETNQTIDNPPTITESYGILKKRFDQKSPFYKSPTLSELAGSRFDTKGNRILGDSVDNSNSLPSSSNSTPNSGTASSNTQLKRGTSDMDSLVKALEDLKINQAQLQSTLMGLVSGQRSSSSSQSSQSPASSGNTPTRSNSGRCMMCGKTAGIDLDHPLGVRRCPETISLVESGDLKVKIDAQGRQRYVMPNGAELPFVPVGTKGGVAEIIRALKATNSQESTRTTSAIELGWGNNKLLSGEVFASYPVLRSGKDTENRFNPMKRPEKAKSGDKSGSSKPVPPSTNSQSPPVSSPPPPSTSQPDPKDKINIPPPQNPINREDGWKGSVPSKSKKAQDDVEMKDASKLSEKKGSNGPQYHFTSDIQDKTDVSSITSQILGTQVTLSLGQIVGSSPALQKSLFELVRSKRVYNTKLAEYSNANIQWMDADGNLITDFEVPSDFTLASTLLVSEPDQEEFNRFFVHYAAKIALPTKKYMAMTCGYMNIEINGKTLRALVDTGSELNIAGSHFGTLTGCAMDFEGMNWSLKGIHGNPERLKGFCPDVPIRIGSHDFPAHVFVSNYSIGNQDIILGQPFFQWFCCRIDYFRSGQVTMMLWKDGDRSCDPTVGITIADPGNERNASRIRPSLSDNPTIDHRTRVEEIIDEEGFQR